jgi:acyl carrier protein
VTEGPVVDRVKAIVTRVAGPDRTPSAVTSTTPLGEGGLWLDSVELLEVILACEAEFDLTFDADLRLAEEALTTVGSLAARIASRAQA